MISRIVEHARIRKCRTFRILITITNSDFSLIEDYYQNYFDKIIVDAPCSGSGMFVKMKNDKRLVDAKVIKFAEIQKSLIAMAYRMLKSGGTMVYSTCSYSYEENEEVMLLY